MTGNKTRAALHYAKYLSTMPDRSVASDGLS